MATGPGTSPRLMNVQVLLGPGDAASLARRKAARGGEAQLLQPGHRNGGSAVGSVSPVDQADDEGDRTGLCQKAQRQDREGDQHLEEGMTVTVEAGDHTRRVPSPSPRRVIPEVPA